MFLLPLLTEGKVTEWPGVILIAALFPTRGPLLLTTVAVPLHAGKTIVQDDLITPGGRCQPAFAALPHSALDKASPCLIRIDIEA